MSKWNLTLKEGKELRNAIEEENYQGIITSLKQCTNSIIKFLDSTNQMDEDDVEYYKSQIEDIQTELEIHQSDLDEEELMDSNLDYTLYEFYNLCDSARIWVAL